MPSPPSLDPGTAPGADLYPRPPVDPATTPDAQRLEQLQRAYTALQTAQNQHLSAAARLAGVMKAEADANTALVAANEAATRAQERLDMAARAAFIGTTGNAGFRMPSFGGDAARPWLDDQDQPGSGAGGDTNSGDETGDAEDAGTALADAGAGHLSANGVKEIADELAAARQAVGTQQLALDAARIQRTTLESQVVSLQRMIQQQSATVTGLKGDVASAVTQGILARPASPAEGVPSYGAAPLLGATTWSGGRLARPVAGPITSPYGNRMDPYYHRYQLHAGIDLAAAVGTPIRAAAPGRVVQSGWNGGYGYYTCVEHGRFNGQRLTTCYGHQSVTLVQPGQTVTAGQIIGAVGSTGASTGPHLHFEVRLGGRAVDPMLWL